MNRHLKPRVATVEELIQTLVVDCQVQLTIDLFGGEISCDGVWTPENCKCTIKKEFHVIGKTVSDALQKAIKEVSE